MIVCLCEGISDRRIHGAIAGGATTVHAVARETGAGTGCGSCRCSVREMLRSWHAARPAVVGEAGLSMAAAPRPD